MRIPLLDTKALVLISPEKQSRQTRLDSLPDDVKLLIARVLNACHSNPDDEGRESHTQRAYADALAEFLFWCKARGTFALNKDLVNQYRNHLEGSRGLAPATINKHLSPIRLLAREAADGHNGILDSATAEAVCRVKGAKRSGTRLGNWLSLSQAQQLLDLPDRQTTKGKRDLAILAVLLGAGLRRVEAAKLTVEHIQQREGRWVIVDLVGKHHRTRSVPIAAWVKVATDSWTAAAGITTGRLFRSVNKGGHLGGSLSAQGLYKVLIGYAAVLGVANLAPHDLRRSFAQLARKSGSALEQIQKSLGHASIQTTEKYLGIQQDLQDAPSDHIHLRVA
jgi:integrase/recombinase XerD